MRHPRLILAPIALAFLASPRLQAELRLEAEIRGHLVPVVGVAHHRPVYADGGRQVPVPLDAKLVIDGDLRANADAVLWSPWYLIARVDVPYDEPLAPPFRGSVNLQHRLPPAGQRKEHAPDVLDAWPQGLVSPGLAVCAWVVDGHPTEVRARAVPETADKTFSATAAWPLTADLARGQAVVLVWEDGHFLPAVAHYADAKAQAAFVAVELDDADALRAALGGGLDPSVRDRRGFPLIQYAAEAGALRCVDTLLAAGAKPDARGPNGTPLTWAIGKGRTAVVARLLAAKPRLDVANDHTSELLEAIGGGYEDVALKLIDAGANRDVTNPLGQPPIAAAVDRGMARVVSALLARGAEIDFHGDQIARVLTTQAKLGHAAMVQLLLDHGVQPDGPAALSAGASDGDPAIARALLTKLRHPDQAGPEGATALMAAATKDHADYAAVLLAAGANPNAATSKGATALQIAASNNAVHVARLLVQHGADVNRKIGRSTALDIALVVHGRETAAVLADAGTHIDLHSPIAPTELERTIAYDLAPVLSAAIAAGWSPNTKFAGWPALDLAEVYHSDRCAAVLRAAGAKLDASAPKLGSAKALDHSVRPAKLVRPVDPREKEDEFPEATVLVDAIIDRDGSVRFPRLAKADDISFAEPAIDAVSAWQFQPATEHGQPVPLLVQVPLVFQSSEEMWWETWQIDVLPVVVKRVAPEYPYDLRRRGYSGNVELRFLVNTSGHTERIRVLASSHPELEQAAVHAVSQWLFKPGQLDGKPVPTWMEVPIVFTLTD